MVWSVLRWLIPVIILLLLAGIALRDIGEAREVTQEKEKIIDQSSEKLTGAGVAGESLESQVEKVATTFEKVNKAVARSPVSGGDAAEKVQSLAGYVLEVESMLEQLGVPGPGPTGVRALFEKKTVLEGEVERLRRTTERGGGADERVAELEAQLSDAQEARRRAEDKVVRLRAALKGGDSLKEQVTELTGEIERLRKDLERTRKAAEQSRKMIAKGRTVIVPFPFNSAQVSTDEEAVLEQVAQAALRDKAHLVRVTGYADTVGSRTANARIARRRAEAVIAVLESTLAGSGIKLVFGEPRGETCLPVATPDNTREPQNRRVEIAIE